MIPLAFILLILGSDGINDKQDRRPRPDASVPLRYEAVGVPASPTRAFTVGGVWRVHALERRFGGVSALAVIDSGLVALTDSGTLIKLALPPHGGEASFRDLPAGPGPPYWKKYRDSEALAANPGGRGWWVGFEFRHSLYLFDRELRRPLRRITFPRRRWRPNAGIEALASQGGTLLALPEAGDEVLRLEGGKWSSRRLRGATGAPADAVTLPDGRVLLVLREFGVGGLTNRLAWLHPEGSAYRAEPFARLPLGRFDNVEGAAAERLNDGGIRLWLITDNDFSKRRATLLIVLDLPARPKPEAVRRPAAPS